MPVFAKSEQIVLRDDFPASVYFEACAQRGADFVQQSFAKASFLRRNG
jgi:hypothetical protein